MMVKRRQKFGSRMKKKRVREGGQVLPEFLLMSSVLWSGQSCGYRALWLKTSLLWLSSGFRLQTWSNCANSPRRYTLSYRSGLTIKFSIRLVTRHGLIRAKNGLSTSVVQRSHGKSSGKEERKEEQLVERSHSVVTEGFREV